MTTTIRPFVPGDLPALYDVCLRTGDSGSDASGQYQDRFLLGHVYCGPYPTADPGLTFVAVDELGVAGYIVATADTAAFERWRLRCWYPELRARYPIMNWPDPPERDRVASIWSDALTEDEELLSRFPAHLHIDLLPRLQHQGIGRALTEQLWSALRERGVPGVHLGVGAGNPSARGFYLRMGYSEFRVQDWGSVMIKELG